MAAGAAVPGLFFSFAAMVLLILVCSSTRTPISARTDSLLVSGIRLATNVGGRFLP